jgi:hypothetical protein
VLWYVVGHAARGAGSCSPEDAQLRVGEVLDDSHWTLKRSFIMLEQTGAEDISSTGEMKGDVQNTDKPMPRAGVM